MIVGLVLVTVMGISMGIIIEGAWQVSEKIGDGTVEKVGIFAEAELKLSDGSNISEIHEQMRWSSCPVKIKWGEEEEEMSIRRSFKPTDNSIVARQIFSVNPVEIALERPEIIVDSKFIDAIQTVKVEISTNETTDAPNSFLGYTNFYVRPKSD